MRKFGAGILVMLLSTLIVYLSAGIIVTRCLHTGVVAWGATTSCDDEDVEGCHEGERHCMMMSLEKLSPTIESVTITPPPVLITTLMMELLPIAYLCTEVTATADMERAYRAPSSPPTRDYLQKIAVLLI